MVLVIAVVVTTILDKKEVPALPAADEQMADANVITVDGKDYERNANINGVLFLGIDKEAITDFGDIPGENGQSDSMNLIVCDSSTKEAQILQISRDTMVDVELYDANGEFRKKKRGQITLQYAFGDGKHFSCRLTTKRVSELLYGVEIEDYFALTLDGMAHVADALGGIPITVPKDYTYIDPAFVEGAEIVLDSELTERYVRYRDKSDIEGNTLRMERQAQFMNALLSTLRNMDSHEELASIYQELEPYMITNLSADEMMELADYSFSEEISMIEGEEKPVDGYLQFHVDNEKLQKKVLDMFYKPL